MAGEVRSLWVSLKARTSAFESGMKRARKELAGLVHAIPGANLVLSQFGAVLSGAAATGFLAWVRHSGEALDATAKFADSLGIAVEKYQALAYAGDLAGVSTEQLQTALKSMTRGVDDAARGTGSAVTAFQRLGLSAVALKRRSPDEQVKAIADALAKVPSAADKAALAMDVFGARNASIVNLLAEGRQGLQAAEADLKSLGLTMSRLEVANVEIANDAWTRFGTVVRGLGQRFAIELSPYIRAAADAMVDWVKESGGAGEVVSTAIGKVVDALSVLNRAWEYVKGAGLGAVGAVQVALGKVLQLFAGSLQALEGLLDGVRQLAQYIPGIPKMDPIEFGGRSFEAWSKRLEETGQANLTEAGNILRDATFTDFGSEIRARMAAARRQIEAEAAAKATSPWQTSGTKWTPTQWNADRSMLQVNATDHWMERQVQLLTGIYDELRTPQPAVMVR